jgi:predicted O-linked N-acetylglucosamine transferase (SPINDLY family)
MCLLREIPGSVLWLRDGPVVAMHNLRNAAQQAGITPSRIVFAPRQPHARHLARLALADIALDTTHHAGGVTTLDALWAGIPIVTLAGPSHPSRTGASILHAMGLPDLVARDAADYRAIAWRLASDPAALAATRRQVSTQRLQAPLFQPARLARHLEDAFARMVAEHRAGRPPAALHIPPIGS